MKRLTLISISTLALSGILTSAHANDFNYNYAQLNYTFFNDFSVDQGISVAGSYDVMDNVNVLGNYFVSTSSDDDVDIDNYSLGLGYHAPFSYSTDLLGEIGLFNTNADVKVGSTTINTDNSGYFMAVGARHKLKEKIEVNARAEHRNSDNVTDTHFTFGTRYYYKPNVSFGAEFDTGADDSSESISGSVRWDFK